MNTVEETHNKYTSKRNENKESKIDGILERSKKLKELMNTSLFDKPIITKIPNKDIIGYINPFHTEKKESEDRLTTLEKIELLEYSGEFNFKYDNKHNKDNNDISMSRDSNLKNMDDIDIKDYDNFVFKIEDLVLFDEKIITSLKNNLLYLECRVPLFKNTGKEQINIVDNQEGIFYDTFKYFITLIIGFLIRHPQMRMCITLIMSHIIS